MPRRLLTASIAVAALCFHRPAHAQAEVRASFEQWVDQLSSGTRAQKVRAAARLGRSKDTRAVEHLEAAVMDPDRSVARIAVMALGMHDSAEAAKTLSAVAQFTDVSVRMLAINGLGTIARLEGIEALGKALQDPDVRIRNCAAIALGSIRSPKATELLMAAVEDTDRRVRSAALMALGQGEDQRTAEFLLHVATKGREELRADALVALADSPHLLRHVNVEEFLDSISPDDRVTVALGLARAPGAKREVTALAARHVKDTVARAAVASAQADRDYQALMVQLGNEAGDEIWKVRRRVEEGRLKTILDLAKSPSPAVICVLAKLCEQNGDARQRQVALQALVRIRSERARLVLRAELARALPHPSGNLLNAVGLVRDPKSVPLLVFLLRSEQSAAKSLAAQTLGHIGSSEAVPALVDLLADSDEQARKSAMFALALIDDPTVTTALVERWEGADDSLRRTIVSALAATESASAVAALRGLLPTSGKLRSDAENAIAQCSKIVCEQNLEALWGALNRYAKEHDGALPKRLHELAPTFLPERQRLVCPGDPLAAQADPRSSFSYMYPVSSKGKLGEPVPIVCDIEPSSHGEEGRNVLFLDGTVKWLPEEDFWKLMETIAEQPREE